MKKTFLFLLFIIASLFLSNLYAQTMPEISTDDNEVWYYIQFTKGEAVLEDFGEATPLMTQNVSLINEEQHWKVVEATTPTGEYKYEIVSAKGNKLCFISSQFVTSKTSTPALFSILNSTSTASPGLVLKNGGGYMNQKGAQTFGRLLERGSSIAAVGSSLVFTPIASMEEPAEAEAPKISSADNSDETWYYIQFTRSTSTSLKPVLQDMGNGKTLMTKNATKEKDDQLWKIVETASPNGEYIYELINRSGRKVSYSSSTSRYTTSSSTFVKLKLTEVSVYWAIQRYGGGSNGMNQDGGAGPERQIADYTYGDQGSTCIFVTHKEMWGTDYPETGTAMENVTPIERFKILTDNKSLTVDGDINKVTIYSVTGLVVDSKTKSFSFELPDPGVYILSVTYNDQTTETVKIAVQ